MQRMKIQDIDLGMTRVAKVHTRDGYVQSMGNAHVGQGV